MEPPNDKRDSRGSSSIGGSGSGSGATGPGALRRRGSLFELVTGRPEPAVAAAAAAAARNLSGSDNAINTRHRATALPLPIAPRRPSNVTIVRPTKEARKAEIVAAVTRRLYTARKKPELRPEPPPSLTEGAEEGDQSEPKELQLCSNARARLQEISKRAIALGLHRKLRKDSDTQTEELRCALRVKEKAVCTDEPTRDIAVETVSTSIEANLCVDFGKRVEMAEKSSQWKAESASVGTQSMSPPLLPPLYHFLPPPPVCTPPFWMNPWWPNLSWGMGCCHHDTKRRANISAMDSADEAFSDDSLESLCGLSRVPDGSSGDSGVHEQKPALWETLTLRSGSHFKDNPSLYQPDVFKTHPLSSIFPKQISYLDREDKSTETELMAEPKKGETIKSIEVGCNTDQTAGNFDENFRSASCPVHTKPFESSTVNHNDPNTKHYPFRLADASEASMPARFQVVCDFTLSCHPFQGQQPAKLTLNSQVCSEDDPKWISGCTCRHDPVGNEGSPTNDREGVAPANHQMLTALSPEVFRHEDAPSPSANPRYEPRSTSSDQKSSLPGAAQSKTPFSTPDIIAQARNENRNGDPQMTQPYREDDRNGQPDPKLECKAGEYSGWWTGADRDYTSLDSSLLHQRSNQPEDPFRAKSFESVFQPQKHPEGKYPTEHNRSASNTVRKFRLPCLSEAKNQRINSALVTARAINEPPPPPPPPPSQPQPSPNKNNNMKIAPKRITPSSFLSPNGRRLLLTWLNNPGSNPPSSASLIKTARKSFTGKVTRRHSGPRDKSRKKNAGAKASAESGGKIIIYHNLSLLLNEATNYVKTLTKRSESREKLKESKSLTEFATQTDPYHSVLHSENRSASDKSSPREKSGIDGLRKDSPVSKIQSNSTATQTWGNIQTMFQMTRTENLGTQCDLTSISVPDYSVNRSTQTDLFWFSDIDLQEDFPYPDEPQASEESLVDPVPYFCPNHHDRFAEFHEMSLHQTTTGRTFDPIETDIADSFGRTHLLLHSDDWTHSRLPCQHSSPRLYLQHLVSLRKGVVEASQSPARPTGVG